MEKNSFISSFKIRPSGIAWMLILFVIMELITRLLLNPNFTNIIEYLEPNYDYGFSHKVPLFYSKEDKIVLYPTEYRRIHEQLLNKDKGANEFRILTVGSSVSRAKFQENYSYFLETLLKATSPEKNWSVTNLSVGGYGSTRIARIFDQAVALKPDLLILHVHGSNEYEDERALKQKKMVNAKFNKVLYKSYFIVVLKKLAAKMGLGDTLSTGMPTEDIASGNKENLERWLIWIKKNLAYILETSERLDMPVILVARAENNEAGKGFESERVVSINTAIKEFSSKKNVYYLDTPQIFYIHYPKKEDKDLLFVDETHWTILGHELIADKLMDIILKLTNVQQNPEK